MLKFFEENWGWFLLIIITIFTIVRIVKHLKVEPTTQNTQSGSNQNTTTNPTGGAGTTNPTPNPTPTPVPTQAKKFSWWKFGIGLFIIILVIGFILRMNTSYSEKVIVNKGQDYTFDVYNERIVINPQVHCIHVIYPDYTEYTFCPNIPINAGEYGIGLYRLQATSDSQLVIISKEPLFISDKFKFWINPIHLKFLFD